MIEKPVGSMRRAMFPLLVLFLCLCTLTSSSIFAWEGPTPAGHFSELESLSGLLTARGDSEISTLVNARRIIQDLSTSPLCAYEPTARLLRQCKVIKPRTEDPAAEQRKMYIQATYGISMALCEARQARIPTPPACIIFESMLDNQRPGPATEEPRPSEIEDCMNFLFDTASWTSYITFRAQSYDLCDSSRVDYQREELLETFRRATKAIPDIVQALQDQRGEAHLSIANLRDMTLEIEESQRQMLASNQDQTRQSKEHLRQMSQYIELYMKLMGESGKKWQTILKDGIDQASKDLALMHQKAGIAQANFAELYAVAADAITGMSYNFEIGVDGMFERVTQLVERIVEFDVEDHMQQLQKSVEFGHDAVKEFAIIQSAQKQVVEDQLSTSQALLQTIKDSQGQFHQIKETLDLIPTSWFEIFSQFRDSVDLLRNEARYALIFTTPSVVLLLFGRLRSAMVVILVYVFIRSIWSILKYIPVSVYYLPISLEDIKILSLCTLGSLCAGGSAALVGSYLLSLFVARRNVRKVRNTPDDAPELEGGQSTKTLVYSNESKTLFQTPRRHRTLDNNRFIRASTV